MNAKIGLWIDHRMAVLVTVGDGGETKTVMSNVETQLRRSGESPLQGSYESRAVPMSSSLLRELTGKFNVYYESVVAQLGGAESIFIFGPGEAKDELRKHLEKHGLGGRVAGVESADRMTENQIAAKARKFFEAKG